VVLESTSYPGTTEEILLPMLEQKNARAGVDDAGGALRNARISCSGSPTSAVWRTRASHRLTT
jgi:hypothetical protein